VPFYPFSSFNRPIFSFFLLPASISRFAQLPPPSQKAPIFPLIARPPSPAFSYPPSPFFFLTSGDFQLFPIVFFIKIRPRWTMYDRFYPYSFSPLAPFSSPLSLPPLFFFLFRSKFSFLLFRKLQSVFHKSIRQSRPGCG